MPENDGLRTNCGPSQRRSPNGAYGHTGDVLSSALTACANARVVQCDMTGGYQSRITDTRKLKAGLDRRSLTTRGGRCNGQASNQR